MFTELGGADMNTSTVEFLRMHGYPFIIKGNGGCIATLTDIQPLIGHDYMAIYKYPSGECCHSLDEIKACFEVIQQ